jgi:hypothetical protein
MTLTACSKVIEPTTDKDDTDIRDTEVLECADDIDCVDGQICTEGNECITGDRDNAFEDATPIMQNAGQQGWIAPAGDVDYYLYPSTGAEWIRINTKTNVTDCTEESTESVDITVSLDTVVAVYSSNGALHAWMDNFPTGRVTTFDSVLNVYLPAAGDWYITVEDTSTFFESDDGPRSEPDFFYCIDVTSMNSNTSETDSSDNPSWSVTLSNNTSIWSVGVVLESAGDSDWLQINLPAPSAAGQRAPLEIWGHEEIPGSSATSLVRVFNEDGDTVLQKADIGPDGIGLYYDAGPAVPGGPVTYLIEATDEFAAGGADNWYVLYFRSREADHYGESESEPNDNTSEAQALAVNVFTTTNGSAYDAMLVHGMLEADDDEDYFAFESTENFYHSIRCAADYFGSFADIALEILDADGNVVASETIGEEDSAPDLDNYVPTTSETHYARIYSENNVYGPGAYYRCYIFVSSFEW